MKFMPPGGARGWNPLSGSQALSRNFNFHFSQNHKTRAVSGNATAEPRKRVSLKGFPLTAAVTAGTLALTGDTIAQFVARTKTRKAIAESPDLKPCCKDKSLSEHSLWAHDFVRALRMGSYGFLLYGPASHFWYQFLDRSLPAKSFQNLLIKVGANQVILGPSVLLVVFAWNFGWMGQLDKLGEKYRRDFAPSMLDGWKFWIPAALLNFTVIPLPGRVAFMSACSVFWNFYLSTSIGNQTPPTAITTTHPADDGEVVEKAPMAVAPS